MKQIPNIFTLINLLFGCIAITLILQNGMIATVSAEGDQFLLLPEKIYWASVFIALAAVIDFLDGFVARLLKASSEMGKQLDSLADVVSFGVAPGLIIYQFLRISFAQQENGLNVSMIWLIPAFIVPCAGAYRLARYNLDNSESLNFKGVPIPAVGLLFASFPLIYWYADQGWAVSLLLNSWFWYILIAAAAYLMISTLPMMSFKFKDLSLKNNFPKIILLITAIIAGLFLGWLAVPIVFVVYVILSLSTLPKESITTNSL
jgi:CDP-diacylglycerol--serine O-phosphatidyltransferase